MVSWLDGYKLDASEAGCGSGLKGPLLDDTPQPEGVSSSSFVTSILSSENNNYYLKIFR